MLNSPVITVVEAKNENIIGGLGQCIAEMVAAKMFNEAEGGGKHVGGSIYGAVTTGTSWKFMKMEAWNVSIDMDEYMIQQPAKILGIFLVMVKDLLRMELV